jgi:hypothetical protein
MEEGVDINTEEGSQEILKRKRQVLKDVAGIE